MGKLDKYIRLNIKMTGNCTGVACAMSLAMGLTAVNFAVIIFAVVFLGISLAALIKGYKRLYYTTLYEEAAYVYNSLPLDPKEVLAGKLFAGSFMMTMYTVSTLAMYGVMLLMAGDSITFSTDMYWPSENTLTSLLASSIASDMLPFALPFEALSMITGAVLLSAIIMFGVIFANSPPAPGKGVAAVILCIILYVVLFRGAPKTAEWLSIDYSPLLPLAQSLINAAATAVLFGYSCKRLEKKYYAAVRRK